MAGWTCVACGNQNPDRTALFADISGFTSLAERLDPEELLEVIDSTQSARCGSPPRCTQRSRACATRPRSWGA